MKSYYRGRTPLVILIRAFNEDLLHLRKGLGIWNSINANKAAVYEKLRLIDPELALRFIGPWEQNPPPYGGSRVPMREMLLCRAVDHFQVILAAFVGEVFKENPDTLRASEPVDISFVLDCGSIDEFRQRVASRKLRQLGRFSAVRKFLKSELKVEVVLDSDSERQVTTAIAIRNVIVHNGGRVDEEFLKLTGRNDVRVGDAVAVTDETLREAFRGLHVAADAFQMALGGKFFGLGATERQQWMFDKFP